MVSQGGAFTPRVPLFSPRLYAGGFCRDYTALGGHRPPKPHLATGGLAGMAKRSAAILYTTSPRWQPAVLRHLPAPRLDRHVFSPRNPHFPPPENPAKPKGKHRDEKKT